MSDIHTEFSHKHATGLLRQHFGHEHFRAGQVEIIRSVVEAHDTLVVMPTGGGKSLCYQLPALMLQGTAIVISPLIALMQDQVRSLEAANIPACFINSTLSVEEIRQRLRDARVGAYKLLYIAPERLGSKQFLEALQRVPLSFLAVDEAHCISEWGHDFRPAYLNIATVNQVLGRLPVVALTATATPEVQTDITRQLQMREPQCFIRGFDRANLRYHVEHDSIKTVRVADICAETLAKPSGAAIVYCASRRRAEEFAQSLRQYNIPADTYHAGLRDSARSYVLNRFLNGDSRVIVATNAFGMGVDKPDVRNVIHCDLTLTLEAYYQEAGRAGRDGEPATCTMLYAPTDRKLMDFFVNATYPDAAALERLYTFLYDRTNTGIGQKATVPLLMDEAAIGNSMGLHTGTVSAGIGLLERSGVVRRGSTGGMAKIQFLATRERMQEYHNNIPESRRNALNALFRLVGSAAYHGFVEFDVNAIAYKYYVPVDEFLEAVRTFEMARLVRFQPPGVVGGLTLALERMPFRSLPIDWVSMESRRERAVRKLDIVQRYAETAECKRDFLLHYFGEYDTSVPCGQCSSCLQTEQRALKVITPRQEFLIQRVLSAAVELDGRFGRTVLAEVLKGDKTAEKVQKFGLHRAESFGGAHEFTKQEIAESINQCIQAGLVLTSPDQYPTVSASERGRARIVSAPEPLRLAGYNREECLYPELLEQCMMLRKELALSKRVGEHVVIDDRNLVAFVNALPRSREEIQRSVRGAGPIFLTQFAPLFLRAVQNFIAAESAKTGADVEGLPDTIRKTVELAHLGFAVETIAEKRGLQAATVAQHLQEALEHGASLHREHFISDALYEAVRSLLRVRNHLTLRDVRAELDTECEWADLRLAVAFVRRDLMRGVV